MSGIMEREFLVITINWSAGFLLLDRVSGEVRHLGGVLFLNFNPLGGSRWSMATFPKMACVAAQAFEVMKPSISSIVISRSSFSVILSVTSCHFSFSSYGSLLTIIVRVSGFSTLLR